ncbi:MAG: UDP-N-acetylmuramoyl-L-alanyl-D-glutamate--2,6-diaminopimelate ligase [Gemmatimonadota bacterium]
MTISHDAAGVGLALTRAGLLVQGPERTVPLTGLTTDSRSLAPGMAYIAVRGSQTDGHKFVAEALRRGAAALVVEAPQASGVPELVVRDGRLAAIAAARAWYDNPGAELMLIGVTGTNGKTTTTALIRHLLNGAGNAGSLGTLGAFDGAGNTVASTAGSLTTPGPVDLQATLAELVRRGVTRVAMETSSHSLDQGRLEGLSFAAGVFTNFTRDHLDYHGTMEDYLAAKLRLSALLAPDGIEVVNQDDPAWNGMPRRTPRLSFGLSLTADVRAEALALDHGGSTFLLKAPHGHAAIRLPLLGEFNVANALAAAAAALAVGEPFASVAAGLNAAPQVPGRMERITERPCVVLRDYAHTPDALARALETLRPLTPGKLIVLFGAGGDRDRGKRPVMGRVAAEGADLVVVTSDNPRTEDPEAIIDDIVPGLAGRPHLRITDRADAIKAALGRAGAGDTVLLAGKGHETYQVVGHDKVPFDERAIVLHALEQE